jgi:hypothetical protein
MMSLWPWAKLKWRAVCAERCTYGSGRRSAKALLTPSYSARAGRWSYWTTDGGGAHDELQFNGNQWTWIEGGSNKRETGTIRNFVHGYLFGRPLQACLAISVRLSCQPWRHLSPLGSCAGAGPEPASHRQFGRPSADNRASADKHQADQTQLLKKVA